MPFSRFAVMRNILAAGAADDRYTFHFISDRWPGAGAADPEQARQCAATFDRVLGHLAAEDVGANGSRRYFLIFYSALRHLFLHLFLRFLSISSASIYFFLDPLCSVLPDLCRAPPYIVCHVRFSDTIACRTIGACNPIL